ncbi:hypothetical protein [Micromonospora sp. CB01531]|uniref:hypothetical protein n=1 Tax=Micromonospora sp. CB01531 TaxID=1718947 RepID=UPI00094003F1|nr:hypothetical protein [Micromonospora sp. CB01531]OKI81624.1 hypothetical protein A6A27_16145 [Micromonospora sp. CB01531]
MFFTYLEKRHAAEIYNITGHAPEGPLDDLNRPRGHQEGLIRVPPPEAVLKQLFGAWRADLENTRKFNTEARDYIACRLMAKIGVRINGTTKLDLDDIKDGRKFGSRRPPAGFMGRESRTRPGRGCLALSPWVAQQSAASEP